MELGGTENRLCERLSCWEEKRFDELGIAYAKWGRLSASVHIARKGPAEVIGLERRVGVADIEERFLVASLLGMTAFAACWPLNEGLLSEGRRVVLILQNA